MCCCLAGSVFQQLSESITTTPKNWDSDFGLAVIKKASKFIRVATHVQFRKLPLWDSSKHDAELD